MRFSSRAAPRGRALKQYIEIGFLALMSSLLAGPALSWSCASEEVLAAEVSPEERARINAEISRRRDWAEAMACIEAGREDCPEAPDLMQPVARPSGD